jgi:leucyl-tRNA synthetase
MVDFRYDTWHMSYDHKSIDGKWQKRWEEAGIFHAENGSTKEKCYLLVEFPYPSGAGLHVGHPRSYTAIDILARKKRMEGKNVLFPMGWDAFGLPAENYAIKTGIHPSIITKQNIDNFRRQLQSMGFSFDWSREFSTTDPEYYKWTQWMFLEFFKAGLAYKAEVAINWCPKDKCGLANEEVVGGACERCGTPVEKKLKSQWMIAITKYADRLLEDLNTVDYLPKIKKQQEEWIGKSEGAEVDFAIDGREEKITVFTTRPDTIFGVTYVVLAPEHPLVASIVTEEHRLMVDEYVISTVKKTDIERGDDTKEKTGVFTGAFVTNPVNNEKVPVWISDYVLGHYGTGAVMAVPQHDDRDRAFAEKFDLPIIDRPLVSFDEAVKKVGGKKKVTYKLRDWVFSRQRYWGEPIPLVHCENGCAPEQDGWVAVPVEQLPVELPQVEKYEPTDNGESPLAVIDSFVNTKCPQCGGTAKRETDTMPNWAGSSWYFLRYADPKNSEAFASAEALKYWMPVDIYNGGMEHTTLHLLYSRFWNKFLFDRGYVPTSEPYARRHSHGMINAEDGRKMSKSWGNVVNPDDVVNEHGADTLRVYEMFMGPFDQQVPWSTNGVIGVRRFLDRVMRMKSMIAEAESAEVTKALHKTIKKVTEDIDGFGFNTAVSSMMIFVNVVYEQGAITKDSLGLFVSLLCPFAPHVANEMHESVCDGAFIESEPWPTFDAAMIVDDEMTIAVQVNGKMRGTVVVAVDASEESIVAAARADENVARYVTTEPKKVIVVKGKLVSFVV